MLDLLEPRYAAIGQRIDALESNMDSLDSLEARYAAIGNRIAALEQPTGYSHFDALVKHSTHLASWSLKDPEHYTQWRSGGGTNPLTTYDPVIDGARVTLSPTTNEIYPYGWIRTWPQMPWNPGNKMIVQHEFMISTPMHDLIMTPGTNGRFTDGFKLTNLCPSSGQIMLELRPFFRFGKHSPVDFRYYHGKLEGRQERDHFASDLWEPTRTYYGSGGGYERHPGPDSTWPYGSIKEHPQTFQAVNDKWVRITYELVRVEEGTRHRIWLADDQHGPALVVASPSNPNLGFLGGCKDFLSYWYCELDTSQETTYAEPMPDRWIGFRNLVVLYGDGLNGETVLGGKTVMG